MMTFGWQNDTEISMEIEQKVDTKFYEPAVSLLGILGFENQDLDIYVSVSIEAFLKTVKM